MVEKIESRSYDMMEVLTNNQFLNPDIFAKAREARKNGQLGKRLDWDKVREIIKENNPGEIYAGLLEDWVCTSQCIYKNGRLQEWDGAAFVGSIWATPVICINGVVQDCWIEVKTSDTGSVNKWFW